MEAASGPAHLPAVCNRKLAEFLRQVDAIDMVWLREIREEAAKMFSTSCSDEPELMPKTPSQKNRPKRRLSSVQDENKDPIRKRLSRRSIKRASAKRCSRRLRSKEDLEIIRAVMEEASPPRRVTRSRAVVSDMRSVALPEKSAVQPVEGRVPLVDISVNDRNSAELHLKRSLPKTGAMVSKVIVLSSDDDSPKKAGMIELQPMSAASVLLIPETTKPKGAREGRSASKLKIANTATSKTTVNREPATEEMDVSAQGPEGNQGSVKELSQNLKDGTGTPTGSKSSRHSVRRSLMCRTSMSCRTSLAEKYSLASKRESMIRKSVSRARSKRIAARQSSLASNCVIRHSSVESLVDEEKNVEVRSELGSTTPCKELPFLQDPQSPRMSLRSKNAKTAVGNHVQAEQQEGSGTESHSDRSDEAQEQPQSVRRKPSYKKAVDELYDGQQAEEGGLSPPRKKTPSPLCPASKVVRPFKTFLHTVQKNQLLMTPCSVGRSSIKKSFIKHNTPLRTDPKEKERQRLESLRRKQEAEQQRKQKLEEEKRQRLEEMKLKREARLRKVLQARERVEQMEEEKKRRIEQKLAQFDEKSEKVREERLAEEKVKKKVAAKKMGDVEARRRQEEEARKQKALQLEEEERRHKERMQKKREEEEQERVRKIAEQRQAEQEREKQLAAERELEKKKEQERIQAERERERQEKEKAARLQRELMAAREKERLQKEMEEKEKKRQEEQRLAELERQEQEKKAAAAASNHLNVTVDVENSPVCNSYQMTPQGPKGPKPPTINPNNYGMDLNSDDSTDDESQPRKPIPAWANGTQLSQAVIHQYYNPPDVATLFGAIISPKLENIFYKNKPRYFKRTSSAVWNSPPFPGAKAVLGLPYSLKKY
ncbi:inner centromere protein-like isoform X1 [Terrapene carolina triunguis]|uniref:inner centromere protein-like isoform X1 n=1 Tax=Terrapene triunguis TaxID=2587831 RepID=UPI000CEFEBE2|nr:inner centromere protein-like isoform X1 [Terrapene carolina triunguis]